MSNSVWYKNERDDKIWWKETEAVGEWIFSFNKKKNIICFGIIHKNLPQKKKKFLTMKTHIGKSFLQTDKGSLLNSHLHLKHRAQKRRGAFFMPRAGGHHAFRLVQQGSTKDGAA